MATLYEGYTLCGVGPVQNSSNIGILGVEQGRDIDYVLVTDSSRSITVYKVKRVSKYRLSNEKLSHAVLQRVNPGIAPTASYAVNPFCTCYFIRDLLAK